MQQAMIISSSEDMDEDTRKLNDVLIDGWKVINMCPMPSSHGGKIDYYDLPTCLVIIEKPDTLP